MIIPVLELMLGQPIFPGDSGVDQLVEIIKVLGTPTREQIKEMNHGQRYTPHHHHHVVQHVLQVFRARTSPEAIDLVSRLLEYTPSARITPLQACAHTFFDELREPGTKLPNGRDLPLLFNFTEQVIQGYCNISQGGAGLEMLCAIFQLNHNGNIKLPPKKCFAAMSAKF